MSAGGSDAAAELRAAAARAIALTWNELLAAGAALSAIGDGGQSADVHTIERAERRLKDAAIAYAKAVDQGHLAASSHRGAPIARVTVRRRGAR